ncbi:SAM-dependent methyltransferase [Carnobacterium divergens]|uniref:class I SAM-dependent methyltransferase n=1 Tax=Carnobacterium divergens TaxID=2748 RepID=UPI000D4F8F16|nr:class I SAM-dependent methyltransferase [Carnobacterium divergens]MCO6018193.1 class I SAM-dependent methyltransferase [Carnobacterium divergens]MPQ20940.1 class I SAM-dependent methyltransferase [Carnobacterium divergens]TFI62008.1 SAM-dependent methyltransferase [Carnobacterium divergens]TFI89280.1 SAM-dependent methyltransferase [Carnobacterium divergens]TFJ03433.1 SAM-dependent methyltransferase [Carnobacterium divergens]
MTLFIILLLIITLYFLYQQLLRQSIQPSGWIGSMMMKLWNNVYLPMAIWSLSFLKEQSFDNILDIGVGNGATTKYISNTFISDFIIGIDISDKAIEQAKFRNSNYNIAYEKKDINKTQYPSNHFDLVCAFQNHFHWTDLRGSFLEIRRILSSDGIFIIGCEYAKIKYFLYHLKEQSSFEKYLSDLGLELMQMEQQKDWIFYKIRKI